MQVVADHSPYAAAPLRAVYCLLLVGPFASLFEVADSSLGGGYSAAFYMMIGSISAVLVVFLFMARPSLPPGFVTFAGAAIGLEAVRHLFGDSGGAADFRPLGLMMLYVMLGWLFSYGNPSVTTDGPAKLLLRSVAVLISGFAIKEYASPTFSANNIDFERVTTVFAHPNAMGMFLVLLLALVQLGALDRSVRGRIGRLDIAVCILLILAIILTKSLTSTVLALVLQLISVGGSRRSRKSGTIVSIAALAVAGFLAWYFVASDRSAEIRQIQSIVSGSGLSETTGGSLYWRLLVWDLAIDRASDSPLIGSGMGSFGDVTGVGNLAHNMFVEHLVEGGTLGVLGLALTIWLISRRLLRGHSDRRLFSFLLIYLVIGGAFSNLANYTSAMCLYIALAGLCWRNAGASNGPEQATVKSSRLQSCG